MQPVQLQYFLLGDLFYMGARHLLPKRSLWVPLVFIFASYSSTFGVISYGVYYVLGAC